MRDVYQSCRRKGKNGHVLRCAKVLALTQHSASEISSLHLTAFKPHSKSLQNDKLVRQLHPARPSAVAIADSFAQYLSTTSIKQSWGLPAFPHLHPKVPQANSNLSPLVSPVIRVTSAPPLAQSAHTTARRGTMHNPKALGPCPLRPLHRRKKPCSGASWQTTLSKIIH